MYHAHILYIHSLLGQVLHPSETLARAKYVFQETQHYPLHMTRLLWHGYTHINIMGQNGELLGLEYKQERATNVCGL